MLSISIKLLLRIDILQNLRSVPPLSISLNHHSVRLDLLDELLSPLRQHVGLVERAHQEDLLAAESLRQVHES